VNKSFDMSSLSKGIILKFLQVKEKRAELQKLKNTFVRRASDFLKTYFASLVDFMISDKSYFSQVHFQVVLLCSWKLSNVQNSNLDVLLD